MQYHQKCNVWFEGWIDMVMLKGAVSPTFSATWKSNVAIIKCLIPSMACAWREWKGMEIH